MSSLKKQRLQWIEKNDLDSWINHEGLKESMTKEEKKEMIDDFMKEGALDFLKWYKKNKDHPLNDYSEEEKINWLNQACQNNQEKMVKWLLKQKIPTHKKDQRGFLPIFYAAEEGHTAILELLIQHGHALSLKDQEKLWELSRNHTSYKCIHLLNRYHMNPWNIKTLLNDDTHQLLEREHGQQMTAKVRCF